MSIVQVGYHSSGIHLLINLYDIFNSELLHYLSRGKLALFEIAEHLGLNMINNFGHQYIPIGYTLTLILPKSHVILHTYPEHNSCYLDIFFSNDGFDYISAINIIKKIFMTDNITYYTIKR